MTEFDIGLGYNSKMEKLEKPSEVRLKKDKVEDAEKNEPEVWKISTGRGKDKEKFWSLDLDKGRDFTLE